MEHRLSAVGVRVHHHAIPTTRDSDLARQVAREAEQLAEQRRVLRVVERGHVMRGDHEEMRGRLRRSEEHTSELQSQSNLVCRLLLEKKKKVSPTRKSPASHER